MGAVIEIIKDKKVIANMFIKDSMVYDVIDSIIEQLKNYNKCLVNSTLQPELLAIRFFEGKDKYKYGFYSIFPAIAEKSKKYIKERYPGFNLTKEINTSYEDGVIAILDEDMTYNSSKADQIITVNLDTSMVFLECCYDEYFIEDYEAIYGDADGLNACDMDLNVIRFNELEDAKKFMWDNFIGWFDANMPETIIVPRES